MEKQYAIWDSKTWGPIYVTVLGKATPKTGYENRPQLYRVEIKCGEVYIAREDFLTMLPACPHLHTSYRERLVSFATQEDPADYAEQEYCTDCGKDINRHAPEYSTLKEI